MLGVVANFQNSVERYDTKPETFNVSTSLVKMQRIPSEESVIEAGTEYSSCLVQPVASPAGPSGRPALSGVTYPSAPPPPSLPPRESLSRLRVLIADASSTEFRLKLRSILFPWTNMLPRGAPGSNASSIILI